jgi:hypothetical protein
VIRLAEPGDALAIRGVHVAAFPTAAEADLVTAWNGKPMLWCRWLQSGSAR